MKLSEFLRHLFPRFEAAGIPWCVARNHERLPIENTGTDIDLAVPSAELSRATDILRGVPGVMMTGYARRFAGVCTFLTGIEVRPGKDALQVDLLTRFTWKGLPYIDHGRFIETSVLEVRDGIPIRIPSEEYEAVNTLFSSLLVGGWIKQKYQPKVRDVFAKCREEVSKVLLHSFTPQSAEVIVNDVVRSEDDHLLAILPRLRRELAIRNLSRPRDALSSVAGHYVSEARIRFTPNFVDDVMVVGNDVNLNKVVVAQLTQSLESTVKCVREDDGLDVSDSTWHEQVIWAAKRWLKLLTHRNRTLTLRLTAVCLPILFEASSDSNQDAILHSAALRLAPNPGLTVLLWPYSHGNLEHRSSTVWVNALQPAALIASEASDAIRQFLVFRTGERLRSKGSSVGALENVAVNRIL